jgi:hypothetical protein
VVPGHRGVEGDDAQAVHVVDAVDGRRLLFGAEVLLVEQAVAERAAVVVVSHDPDHLGAEPRCCRFDDGAEVGVSHRIALVGEVPRDDDRLGPAAGGFQLVEELPQIALALDGSVERPFGHKMRVAEVEDEVVRPRILCRSEAHGFHSTRQLLDRR